MTPPSARASRLWAPPSSRSTRHRAAVNNSFRYLCNRRRRKIRLGGVSHDLILVYGRNDSYGYNLHERSALGLNCIAELLTDPKDEILFVDYNTPNDLPTFPEAIRDTLTKTARQKLRVLRVRSYIHERFANRTPLSVLPAIARNVGWELQ